MNRRKLPAQVVATVTVQYTVLVTRLVRIPRRLSTNATDLNGVVIDYVNELDFDPWQNSIRRADAEYEACTIEVDGQEIYDSTVGRIQA